MTNPANIICAVIAIVMTVIIFTSPQEDPCKPPLTCCGQPGEVTP